MSPDALRARWRERKARRRERVRAAGLRCTRCVGLRDEPGLSQCSRCRAGQRQRKAPLRAMEHDTAAHAAMLLLARRRESRCAVTGLALADLRLIGQGLEVDRIDPRRGYMPDNMRLVARTVNRSKHNRAAPCERTVDALVDRVWAVGHVLQSTAP